MSLGGWCILRDISTYLNCLRYIRCHMMNKKVNAHIFPTLFSHVPTQMPLFIHSVIYFPVTTFVIYTIRQPLINCTSSIFFLLFVFVLHLRYIRKKKIEGLDECGNQKIGRVQFSFFQGIKWKIELVFFLNFVDSTLHNTFFIWYYTVKKCVDDVHQNRN